jgi:biotin carboxylase
MALQDRARRPRALLLLPTTTYRAADFLAAAERLGVEVVAASEKPNVMAEHHPEGLITLDFRRPEEAARRVAELSRSNPIDAVIPVDDETAVVAAAIGAALGLKHNSVEAARAARDKSVLVTLLRRAGLRTPRSRVCSLGEQVESVAATVQYPCVLKPLFLSGSRGVIRADDPSTFAAAWRRIAAILCAPEVSGRGGAAADKILVEDYIPGTEFALEGLLSAGELQVLAIFDKPDPLEGPFFEETLYVTPSRHPSWVQAELTIEVASAARALGLVEGPIHAELRYNAQGAWVLELAARSIGGLCSRALRFGTGLRLEDLILRHALDLEPAIAERESRAAGVMMIPIPGSGILRGVHGTDAARAVAGIEEVTITARLDNPVVPLPEGASYLGFIFARADTPEQVETALRQAHAELRFEIEQT